jgi:hypothetical protein
MEGNRRFFMILCFPYETNSAINQKKVSFIFYFFSKLGIHFYFGVASGVTFIVTLHLYFCMLTLPLSMRLMSTIQEAVASR